MTLDEKLAISNKACALWDVGNKEGYKHLTMPMPPYLVGKSNKGKSRIECLITT